MFVNIGNICHMHDVRRDNQYCECEKKSALLPSFFSPAKTSATKLVTRVMSCVSPCKNTGIDRMVPTNGKTMSVSFQIIQTSGQLEERSM